MDISGLGVYSGIPLGLDSSFSSSDYRGRRGKAGVSFDLSRSTDSTGLHVSDEDKRLIRELQKRDQEVRAHERAHKMAAGELARGSISYTYQIGPDGRRYAIGGEVRIDASPGNTPEESLERARKIRAAASAPSAPSAQDHSAAADAAQLEAEARSQLRENEREQGESRSSLDGPVQGVSGPPELGGPAESISGPPQPLNRAAERLDMPWTRSDSLLSVLEENGSAGGGNARQTAFAAQDAQAYGLEAADQATVDAAFSIALNGNLARASAIWQGSGDTPYAQFAVDPLRDGSAASGLAGVYPADHPAYAFLEPQTPLQSLTPLNSTLDSFAFASEPSYGLSSGTEASPTPSDYLSRQNEEYAASLLDLRRAAQAYASSSPASMLVPYGLGTGISLQI